MRMRSLSLPGNCGYFPKATGTGGQARTRPPGLPLTPNVPRGDMEGSGPEAPRPSPIFLTPTISSLSGHPLTPRHSHCHRQDAKPHRLPVSLGAVVTSDTHHHQSQDTQPHRLPVSLRAALTSDTRHHQSQDTQPHGLPVSLRAAVTSDTSDTQAHRLPACLGAAVTSDTAITPTAG